MTACVGDLDQRAIVVVADDPGWNCFGGKEVRSVAWRRTVNGRKVNGARFDNELELAVKRSLADGAADIGKGQLG